MTHTSPRPVKVTYHSDMLHADVRRVVGYGVTCPNCGESKVSSTVARARQWLSDHSCQPTEGKAS